MQKRLFIPLVLVLLLLAACGGSSEPSPTLTPTGGGASIPATEPPSEEPTEQPSDPTAAPVSEEPTAESAPSEEATATPEGEAETAPTGERQMSGTDPDTGLEINPEQIVAGVEFIARGEIVSMTLTPQDAPEFVILSPAGKRYRFRPQALSEIFFEDGSQLAVHQYQLGLMAGATLYLDPAGGVTAIATSTDMVLYSGE